MPTDAIDDHLDRQFYFDKHDSELHCRVRQTNRDAILEQNKQFRREGLRDLSFARWALSIPELDHRALVARNPDLKSPDAKVRSRAWMAFINSPESRPYRVHNKV